MMRNGDLIQVLVIDPFAREVRRQLLRRGELSDIHNAIGFGCTCFASGGYLENDDCLYVDDEGLFAAETKFFKIGEAVIAGRALVLDTDNQGGSIEPASSTESLLEKISWQR